MNTFHIYQTNSDYMFLPFCLSKDKFNINDYDEVYSGEILEDIDDFEFLEKLYMIFNINHPDDYHSRSVSVSDVVKIVKENIIFYYYCDNFGWKKLDF